MTWMTRELRVTDWLLLPSEESIAPKGEVAGVTMKVELLCQSFASHGTAVPGSRNALAWTRLPFGAFRITWAVVKVKSVGSSGREGTTES